MFFDSEKTTSKPFIGNDRQTTLFFIGPAFAWIISGTFYQISIEPGLTC